MLHLNAISKKRNSLTQRLQKSLLRLVVLGLVIGNMASFCEAGLSQVSVSIPNIISTNGEDGLAFRIKIALLAQLELDSRIRLFSASDDEPTFKINIVVKKHSDLDNYGLVETLFTAPSGHKKMLKIEYFNEEVLGLHGFTRFCQKTALAISKQLKIEASLQSGPRLKSHLNPEAIRLFNQKNRAFRVEILDAYGQKESEKQKFIRKKTLSERKYGTSGPILLDLVRKNKYKTPSSYTTLELPSQVILLNPFRGEALKKLQHRPSFNYPGLRVSGPFSTILLPSLSWHETDSKYSFSVEAETHWAANRYKGKNGIYSMDIDGNYFRQSLSLSTQIWSFLNLGVELAEGIHDGRYQMDLSSPSAPGGTTFLEDRKLRAGLEDLQLFMSTLVQRGRTFFRPGLRIKLPTGSSRNLLSSGHPDFSLGFSLEHAIHNWQFASRISFVTLGDLEIFAPSQKAALPIENAIVFSLGLGKTLNVLRGEKASLSLNIVRNPFRDLSSFEDLDKDIITAAFLIEKKINPTSHIRAEISFGLSRSAPPHALSLTFKINQ